MGAAAHPTSEERLAQSREYSADVQDAAVCQRYLHELRLADEKGAMHSCCGVAQRKVQAGCCGAEELLPKLPGEVLHL